MFNFRINVGSLVLAFCIVALLGVLMRYKMLFTLPWLDQKSLQQAHSHFAFNGWVTTAILFLFHKIVEGHLMHKKRNSTLIALHFLLSLGQVVSFLFTGYSFWSIVLLTATSIIFGFSFFSLLPAVKNYSRALAKWFVAGALAYFVSLAGTIMLGYLSATKQLDQKLYLSSVYFFLHFQYNGWFFFALVGLFNAHISNKYNHLLSDKISFVLFALTLFPLYGLSVLWFNLPVWLYAIIVGATVIFVFATFHYVIRLRQIIRSTNKENSLSKWLHYLLALAFLAKSIAQLVSVIPALNEFVFGFRSVIIAYLHLVLLVIISLTVFYLFFAWYLLPFQRFVKRMFAVVVFGIVFNELLLATQAIFSLFYQSLPMINELLLTASLVVFFGALGIWFFLAISGKKSRKNGVYPQY